MSPANGRLKFAPGLRQSRPRRGRVPTAPKPAASDSAAAWSPCRVNQNMDKEWPHELALTCLGHQVTIVRLGEQVTTPGQLPCCRMPCGAGAMWLLICSWLQQAAGCHAEVKCLLAARKQQEPAVRHGVAGQQKPPAATQPRESATRLQAAAELATESLLSWHCRTGWWTLALEAKASSIPCLSASCQAAEQSMAW